MTLIAAGVGLYLIIADTIAFGVHTRLLGFMFLGIGIGGFIYGS